MILAEGVQKFSPPKGPSLQTEVEVATATIVLINKYDTNLVLVANSVKHSAPVLPGGTIEEKDIGESSIQSAAARCIKRELFEEVGVNSDQISFIGTWHIPGRDVRNVPAKKLRDSSAGAQLKGCHDEEVVRASYGHPDYLFYLVVDPDLIRESDELKNPQWTRIDTISNDSLGAKHHIAISMYRAAIANSEAA